MLSFPDECLFGLMTVFTDELTISSPFSFSCIYLGVFLIGGGSFPGHF